MVTVTVPLVWFTFLHLSHDVVDNNFSSTCFVPFVHSYLLPVALMERRAPFIFIRFGRRAERFQVGGRWQRRGRRPLECPRCAAAFDHEFQLEEHEAWHLRQPHQCPWPGCPYSSSRRGTLRHHWKTHLANGYRFCADGSGWRSAETDLIAPFEDFSRADSGMYTRDLQMIHRQLTIGMFKRDAALLRNVIAQADKMAGELHQRQTGPPA